MKRGARKSIGVVGWLCCCAGIAAAQVSRTVPAPSFEASKVLPANSDEFIPLAPGMLASIYGENLGPQARCTGRGSPMTGDYPQRLCETQVLLGDIPAGLLYVHQQQINFQVPLHFPEGPTSVRVIYRGQSSRPVGREVRMLSLAEPAYVHRPVWLRVELPSQDRGVIRYPFTVRPWDFGVHEFEVRGSQGPLQKIAYPRRGVLRDFPDFSRLLGLPREPEHKYRIPLHLQYRFDQLFCENPNKTWCVWLAPRN